MGCFKFPTFCALLDSTKLGDDWNHVRSHTDVKISLLSGR